MSPPTPTRATRRSCRFSPSPSRSFSTCRPPKRGKKITKSCKVSKRGCKVCLKGLFWPCEVESCLGMDQSFGSFHKRISRLQPLDEQHRSTLHEAPYRLPSHPPTLPPGITLARSRPLHAGHRRSLYLPQRPPTAHHRAATRSFEHHLNALASPARRRLPRLSSSHVPARPAHCG